MAALHLARRWSLLFTCWEVKIFCILLLAQPNQTQSTHCRVTDTLGEIQLEGCWVMVLSVIILTVGRILWGTLTLFPVHQLLHSCTVQWLHDLLDVIASVSIWCVLVEWLPLTQGVLVTVHFLFSVCATQVCEGTKASEASGPWTCRRGTRDRDCDPFLNPHVLFFFIQELHWLHSPSSHSEVRWPGWQNVMVHSFHVCLPTVQSFRIMSLSVSNLSVFIYFIIYFNHTGTDREGCYEQKTVPVKKQWW